MNTSDEIAKLAELHARGALNDDEFSRAKARVLDGGTAAAPGANLGAVNSLRRSRMDRSP